ncbi:MAG: hypothetical protein CVU06_04100 [Bacteroidetes bacterium HGW-Bacteroidetes-22]|nr:MAG: hypothetical protein CVU06_04100 [Bacteroidetes bacterium HGW-Bacteroidetes-22]
MKSEITDFALRANYPNYRCTNYFCDNFGKTTEASAELPGYGPPEIEYHVAGQKSPCLLVTGYIDAHLLFNMPGKEGRQYLMHLIREQEGNRKSIDYLEAGRQAYRGNFRRMKMSMGLIENKFVVPSVTTKQYSVKFVSHKGANLIGLTQEGFPVPDFCILTTKSYKLSPPKRQKHLISAIYNLELLTSDRLGNPENPLIFAVRCALPEYLPGLMPTYLNVGVTDEVFHGLKKIYGDVVAEKIYYNNLKTIFSVLCNGNDHCNATAPLHEAAGTRESLRDKIGYYHQKISEKEPAILTDAFYQFSFFVKAAASFYADNQDLIYTFQKGERARPALILQKMVWTVRDDDSHPGVLYSRHSRTGLGMQIESFNNIFGEDIMTGLIKTEDTEFFHRDTIKEQFPGVYHFSPYAHLLEKKLKSAATVEFAVESSEKKHLFAILQLDNSEMTGRATLLSTIDLYQNKIINKERVVKLIMPYHLRQIFSERIDDDSFNKLQFFSHGISILPRTAVSARLFFSSARAIEAKRGGDRICYCKSTYCPTDRMVMSEVDAILSLTPAAIHVVTACLGYGIPALINLENNNIVLRDNTLINEQGHVLREGDWITISSKQRTLFAGKATFKAARFQKYLEGQKLELEAKEEKVFINMSKAYKAYQAIVDSIEYGEITKLSDLTRLIRNDLDKKPEKAQKFVNAWFDSHTTYYVQQILKSQLGTHLEQHNLYNLLTISRRILFFKTIIPICRRQYLQGYSAGAFMIGRFICQHHPVEFWKALTLNEIVFLLNEYILFEKYLQVLNDFGEKHINRARSEILSMGLGQISMTENNAVAFIALKLANVDWTSLAAIADNGTDQETRLLIRLIKLPYGVLFNYDQPWSVGVLEEICRQEQLPLPDRDAV